MSKKKKKERDIKGKVLKLFKQNSSKTYNYKQIAAQLEIKDTQSRNAIIKALGQMTAQQILEHKAPGKYSMVSDPRDYKEGMIDINTSGNAYLINEEGEDTFIARKNINRAMDGDRVLVYTFKRKRNGKKEGEVVEVLERKRQNFVGILERRKDFGFVNTKGSRLHTDFFIEKEELKEFKEGDKVIVELKEWPKRATSPFGKIIKSLGKPGKLNTEMHAIMYEYGFPDSFPEEVEKYVERLDLSITKKEIQKRRDFRDKTTFTIDPVTAKDFDDALSCKELNNGNLEIGIHIADVSHYVKPRDILDEEAYDRATSVYLVDRVVPMLPEILSNGACSLRPKEEKYTFSAVFEVNPNMEIVKEWFGKTVILSDHRFSYEEVQYLLDTEGKLVSEEVSLTQQKYQVSEPILQAITKLNKFAKHLREKRMRNGALSFDRIEVKFHLDVEDNPEGVYFKTTKDAHKLVEELMLLANRRVAEFIEKKKPVKPFVYRVHDVPDQDKLTNLKTVATSLGYSLNIETKNINNSLNHLLKESHGKKEQQLLDTLTLRCMSKAKYTTKNIGHYGLAFKQYTHFTSPIRRYPDVLVHRLLEHYLEGGKAINSEALEEACIHSSNREQLATKAERDSVKYMQVKFMENKIGQSFDGIISGVTERGIFVELNENKCEGLVKVSEIKGDYFVYQENIHSLVGQRSQKKYQLGDPVNIILKKADLIKRQLDFVLDQQIE